MSYIALYLNIMGNIEFIFHFMDNFNVPLDFQACKICYGIK
jgi:hypothetical protein